MYRSARKGSWGLEGNSEMLRTAPPPSSLPAGPPPPAYPPQNETLQIHVKQMDVLFVPTVT